MKRCMTLALLVGAFSIGGFVGCDHTEKTKEDVKVEGPGGKKEIKTTQEVTTDGKNPPVVETTKP